MEVELIDHMGSDLTVVNAARVSFGKRKKEFTEGDKKLIGFLAKHGHWSPFGHGSLQYFQTILLNKTNSLLRSNFDTLDFPNGVPSAN